MKRLIILFSIALGGLFIMPPVSSQESVRDRIARRQNQQQNQQSIPPLTVRAENMNQDQTQEIGNAPWMREVYRFLDLDQEKNAPLYFPVTPIGERMNLFTMIFKLLANGELTAYEFQLDRIETFTEDNKLNVKDLLDRFRVMYTEQEGRYIVEDVDIPSNEVLGYYIKEAWYFDKTNSVVDIKILAICPIIFTQGDYDIETSRYPLFWLPYEQIRPYAARMPIMVSNLNNASTETIDDFFRKHNFDGEIYKTTNMKNLSLAQMYQGDEEQIKTEREKIESQLIQFKDKLWAMNDSIPTETNAKSKKDNKKDSSEKDSSSEKVRTNEDKKSSSSSTKSSAPARSMRNRR